MNNASLLPGLAKDIRFWIALSFVLRLYGITAPPLEVSHNWRQADVLMIARNFYESDANILYPEVDVGGEAKGYVGCEFPILNYLIYLVAEIFGYEHWHGRLIVLLTSCFGVFYFYRVIRNFFSEQAAFNGAVILMVSLWFSYSRKIIPDVFAVSLCIMALHFALEYLYKGKAHNALLYFILGTTGCLSKILGATILTILMIPMLDRSVPIFRKVVMSLAGLVTLLTVCLWYFYWVPHLNALSPIQGHFFMGFDFHEGFKHMMAKLPGVIKRFVGTGLKYSGFIVFAVALILLLRERRWLAVAVFALPFISFLILLVKTGGSIVNDQYYLITVLPCMAFAAGLGLTYLKKPFATAVVLVIIAFEGIVNQAHDFVVREPYASLADLESIMDGVSDRNDRIAVNAGPDNPTMMYFAHRKGWTTFNHYLTDRGYQEFFEQSECRFVVLAKRLHGDADLPYPIVYNSEYFKIYELKRKP